MLLTEIARFRLFDSYPEDYDVWLRFSSFIDNQNKTTRALEVAEHLNDFIAVPDCGVSEDTKARLYNLLGILNNDLNRPSEAERYFLESIAVHERLAKATPTDFSPTSPIYITIWELSL